MVFYMLPSPAQPSPHLELGELVDHPQGTQDTDGPQGPETLAGSDSEHRHEGDDDDDEVEDVPAVAQVGTLVKHEAKADGLDGELEEEEDRHDDVQALQERAGLIQRAVDGQSARGEENEEKDEVLESLVVSNFGALRPERVAALQKPEGLGGAFRHDGSPPRDAILRFLYDLGGDRAVSSDLDQVVVALEVGEEDGQEQVHDDHDADDEDDEAVDDSADADGAVAVVHDGVPVLTGQELEDRGQRPSEVVEVVPRDVRHDIERVEAIELVDEGDLGAGLGVEVHLVREELHANQRHDVHEEGEQHGEVGNIEDSADHGLQKNLHLLPLLRELEDAEEAESAEGRHAACPSLAVAGGGDDDLHDGSGDDEGIEEVERIGRVGDGA